MYQLIYVSTVADSLGEDDLESLVEHARRKNERLGITGVLVYRNGSFLHVLEGEDEETVRGLYDTIRRDERHQWVTLLKASALGQRDFPGAPLAFHDRSVLGARRLSLNVQQDAAAAAEEEEEAPLNENMPEEMLLQWERAGGGSGRAAGSSEAPEEGTPPPNASGSASEAAAS